MSSPYLFYDGAKINPESQLGKELMKWERPFDYRPEANPYPRMLYKAQHRPDGKRSVHEVNDRLFADKDQNGNPMIVPGAAEQWSRRCQLTVKDDYEKQRAYENGWRNTPQEAMELLEARDNHIDTLTAERHAADARMSPQAQAEAAAIDQTTLRQIPSIPETPIRKRRKYTRKASPDQAA